MDRRTPTTSKEDRRQHDLRRRRQRHAEGRRRRRHAGRRGRHRHGGIHRFQLSTPVAATINLSTGTGTGGVAQGDTLSGIENVIATAADDTLIGDGNGNQTLTASSATIRRTAATATTPRPAETAPTPPPMWGAVAGVTVSLATTTAQDTGRRRHRHAVVDREPHRLRLRRHAVGHLRHQHPLRRRQQRQRRRLFRRRHAERRQRQRHAERRRRQRHAERRRGQRHADRPGRQRHAFRRHRHRHRLLRGRGRRRDGGALAWPGRRTRAATERTRSRRSRTSSARTSPTRSPARPATTPSPAAARRRREGLRRVSTH